MKKSILLLLMILGLSSCTKATVEPVIHHNQQSRLPVWSPEYRTTYVETYRSGEPDEKELEGVQCPIPMKDRVKNYTGIQCVFSSIEMIGRWAECKQLIDPPITSRSDCKSFSGPSDAASKLTKLGVKFEQSYKGESQGIALIKKAMAEGRGCLFGVPGHAMVLIHYDEEKDVVKWVDNSDSSLRVQTMTVKKFKSRWDSWCLVIYADPDVVPDKLNRTTLANQIPIIDRNGVPGSYPKDYIPFPKKE
jgi:hypothetical protein